MADNPIPEILADLPEDWGYGQIVSPEGTEAGLTPQHGYNYLMRKVNATVRAINEIVVEIGQIAPKDMVTAAGGGQLILPGVLGDGPYVITFTEEETAEYALKSDLSKYAPLLNPTFKNSIIVGPFSHANEEIGSTQYSIIAGYMNYASADSSITVGLSNDNRSYANLVVGDGCKAYNSCASCIGSEIEAVGNYSLGVGFGTIAGYLEFVCGSWNVKSDKTSFSDGAVLIAGNGRGEDTRSNAFRVSKDGEVFGGQYHSSGADYAEIYEWADGNPDAEDRAGRFVCLDGEKIRFAGPDDHILDVLGIVSAAPSIVGDSHNDQWRNMYLRDIFGRLIYEDVEVEDPANPGKTIMAHRRKLNPAYDHTQKYIPQSQRPEKSAVGLLGKLVVIDDGTCEVNGWACPGPSGIATRSGTRNRFRVMSRLDGTHIRVNIMVQ